MPDSSTSAQGTVSADILTTGCVRSPYYRQGQTHAGASPTRPSPGRGPSNPPNFSKDGSAGGHPRIESHGVGASEKALHLLPPTARQGDPHMLPWLAVSVGSLLLVGFAARGHR